MAEASKDGLTPEEATAAVMSSMADWARSKEREQSQMREGKEDAGCRTNSRMDCLPSPALPPVTRMVLPWSAEGGMSVRGLKDLPPERKGM